MQRRYFKAGCILLPTLAACSALAPDQGEKMKRDQSADTAPGTNKDFSFSMATRAPDQIRRLWTSPSTWGAWDKGLHSASMEGEMGLGSVGMIQPLSGPASQFEVVSFEPNTAYTFVTRLPMARLTVARSLNAERTEFTHHVTFTGPMGFAFARMFGPGFRKALPPTMRTLNTLAEAG